MRRALDAETIIRPSLIAASNASKGTSETTPVSPSRVIEVAQVFRIFQALPSHSKLLPVITAVGKLGNTTVAVPPIETTSIDSCW